MRRGGRGRERGGGPCQGEKESLDAILLQLTQAEDTLKERKKEDGLWRKLTQTRASGRAGGAAERLTAYA